LSPSPRVLVLVTLAEIGGAQEYVAALLPALVEQFDVTVAAWGPGPLRATTERAGAHYVPLRHVRRAIRPWRDFLGLVELIRLFRRERPQILHANSSKAGILGRLAAAITRVPIRIFTVHGWVYSASSGASARLYRLLERLMRPLTTATICVSENGREVGLRARTCRADRTVVIRNAVDVSAARRSIHEAELPLIVSVGRLKAPKDFPTLVRALAVLEPGSFRCIVVGDGPRRAELLSEIERHHLGQTVELAGERDDIAELLSTAEIFVLSSASEGMPISIIEAMAAELPVVATAVGGIPELVIDGETGFLVPARDAGALSHALGCLVADPALRRQQGKAARARAEKEFDLPAFRRAHVELYSSLLAARGIVSSRP
jgi:glycosyltransferase involved in cell wall biosynthesis